MANLVARMHQRVACMAETKLASHFGEGSESISNRMYCARTRSKLVPRCRLICFGMFTAIKGDATEPPGLGAESSFLILLC